MIAVRLQHKEGESFSSFRNHLMGLPEILNIFHTAGREDFLVHVAVRDSEHLRQLAMTHFLARKEVEHLETALIFEHLKKNTLPIYKKE